MDRPQMYHEVLEIVAKKSGSVFFKSFFYVACLLIEVLFLAF